MGRRGPWIGGKLAAKPSEIFRSHCFVAPFPEEDPVGLSRSIGVDNVLMGSDFPHPEGLADPESFAESLDELDDRDIKKIMHDNLAGLLGVGDMPATR
jgi:predicted TIM-barrel fold metal-dependent hydrolase